MGEQRNELYAHDGSTALESKPDVGTPYVPIPQKLLLTVEEAAAYSNIGLVTLRTQLKDP